MISRKDINHRYYSTHKDELKQRKKKKQLEELKGELESLSFVEVNPYLNKMNLKETENWEKERKRKFELEYDIEHFNFREKGDFRKYRKEKEINYKVYCRNLDLKYRLEYYRLFRNSYLKKHGKEPNLTLMLINNNMIPPEVNPKSEFYDKSLLCHLEIQPGDKEIEIKEISDLTSDDEE